MAVSSTRNNREAEVMVSTSLSSKYQYSNKTQVKGQITTLKVIYNLAYMIMQ